MGYVAGFLKLQFVILEFLDMNKQYTFKINISRVGFEPGVGGVTLFEDCEATAFMTQPPQLVPVTCCFSFYT